MGSRLITIIFGIVVLMMPGLPLGDDAPHDVDAQTVFDWVAAQMHVEVEASLPPIHFVSRSELHRVFESCRAQSYQNWQTLYGSGRARQMMDDYLKGLVGMFNPDTGHIYVGRFLSPCRQKAILAHELAHYFQTKGHNERSMAAIDATMVRLFREVEASTIENRYMEQFCPDQAAENINRQQGPESPPCHLNECQEPPADGPA